MSKAYKSAHFAHILRFLRAKFYMLLFRKKSPAAGVRRGIFHRDLLLLFKIVHGTHQPGVVLQGGGLDL